MNGKKITRNGKKNNRDQYWLPLIYCFACLASSAVLASDANLPSSVDNAVVANEDSIEEVVVTGEQQLETLRREVVFVETELLSLFNQLNSDDDYDIICKKETRIGSQIKRRTCLARLYRDSLSDKTVGDYEGNVRAGHVLPNEEEHMRVLRRMMHDVADDDPQFQELLDQHQKLISRYKTFKEQ